MSGRLSCQTDHHHVIRAVNESGGSSTHQTNINMSDGWNINTSDIPLLCQMDGTSTCQTYHYYVRRMEHQHIRSTINTWDISSTCQMDHQRVSQLMGADNISQSLCGVLYPCNDHCNRLPVWYRYVSTIIWWDVQMKSLSKLSWNCWPRKVRLRVGCYEWPKCD